MNRQLVIPLNRRDFVAAGAGLLSATILPMADGGESKRPLFQFALVSDTHLGRRGDRESNLMATAVGEINRSRAAFTLFCGDLVDHGENAENEGRYPEWLRIAGRLKNPFHAIPGNHDPRELFRKHLGKPTDFAFDHRRFRFVCFADAEPNPGHNGVVTEKQIAWIRSQVQQASKKRKTVILASHVTYHRNQHPDTGWWIKKGHQELGVVLKSYRKTIAAFFSGHFHCGLRGWNDNFGIHEVVLPAVSWNRDRGLKKAPGFALNDFRSGYVMADVFGDRMVLRYKPLGAEVRARRGFPI